MRCTCVARKGARWFRALTVAVLFPAGLTLAGCSSGDGLDRQPVTGSVTLDGAPLAKGTIRFTPTSNEAGTDTSAEISGGKYAFSKKTGPVAGNYSVSISSIDDPGIQAKEGMVPGDFRPPTPKDTVPPQYNVKTTLTAAVKAGASESIDFNLTKGGPTSKK
jgi:hypothetical protein